MDCGISFCTSGCPVNIIPPDWNDLVYRGDWKEGHPECAASTNNFPQASDPAKRPVPGEAACTLNINNDAVGIKSIEHDIIDKGGENGWVVPGPARRCGKKSPSSSALGAWRRRSNWPARDTAVTVFEKNSRIGGLSVTASPLEAGQAPIRLAHGTLQPRREFPNILFVGEEAPGKAWPTTRKRSRSQKELPKKFDAVILGGGSATARLAGTGPRIGGRALRAEIPDPQNKEMAGTARTR